MMLQKNNSSLWSSVSAGHMPDRTEKIWDLSFHSCNNDISFASTGIQLCGFFSVHGWFVRLLLAPSSSGEWSITITVSTNQSFCYNNFEIQYWYVITKFHVNNMTIYMCDIHEIKKYAQVKVVLTFMIESVRSCFLIHYTYTIHAIVVKNDDIRTRNPNVLWILSCIYQ